MPQFHETRMGVKFFEADLPRIIAGLEKLADALDKRNTHPADKPDATNGVADYRAPLGPVQLINKQLPHMNLDERRTVFEAVSRGYCTECGRPLTRSATEIACTCPPRVYADRARYINKTLFELWRRIQGTNFQDQLPDRELENHLLVSSAYLVGTGSCTDSDNCGRCRGDITKPHAGIPS